MAQVPKTSVSYIGDGATRIYDITFPYLTQGEVFARVNGEDVPYVWLSGSTASIQLEVAPVAGANIEIYRSTVAYVPRHVFAAGTPFLPRYVDENNRQLLYATQEAINSTAGDAAEALLVAEEARDIAQDALDKIDDAVIDSAAQLRIDLATPAGAGMVGYGISTVGAQMDLVRKRVIYADDPRFGGDIFQAVAALDNYTTLVVREVYTVNRPVKIPNRRGVIVACVGEGQVRGSRTDFTFPDADARGILHFADCDNCGTYGGNYLGALTAKGVFGADVKADGDAGVEYLRCVSPRTIKTRIDSVMTWGVIHIGCSDTAVLGCKISNTTRQSGVGHASVDGGVVEGCTIWNSGLYGIEVEGPTNRNIKVRHNTVFQCLVGIALIGDANSCEITDNTVYLCTYLIQANTNGATNRQVGTLIARNRTYDGRFHFYVVDSEFVDLMNNTSLGRVASAFLPQRPADHVVGIVAADTVLILDGDAGNIVVGDVHAYNTGATYTVKTVGTSTDPVYGTCWRITYTTNVNLVVGNFFSRATDLIGSGSWLFLAGTRSNALTVKDNSANGQFGALLELTGAVNELRWKGNTGVGMAALFKSSGAAALTNSTLTVVHGDVRQMPFVAGTAESTILPHLDCTVRSLTMSSPTKATVFQTRANARTVRMVITIQGSVKTANTGNVFVTLNDTNVVTIPVADIGTGLLRYTVAVNMTGETFKVNIADTYGDLAFSGAYIELHTIEA